MKRLRLLDDLDCVALSQQGDRDAFAELVRRYQDRVFRFVLRLVGGREEALELTQDAFLKAYQGLGKWQPEAKFHTWLFRLAHNAAMDQLRRRKIVEYVAIDDEAELPDHAADPASRFEMRQRCQVLESALRELPLDSREILLLREIEDLSYTEIAEALGVAEGTVKSRLARARAALLEICRTKKLSPA